MLYYLGYNRCYDNLQSFGYGENFNGKNWRALWQKNEHGKDRQAIKVITGKRVKVSIWSQTEGEFAAKRPSDAKICNTSVWSSTQSGQSSSYVPEFHHGTQIHHSLVLESSQNLLRPHTHRPDQLFALTDPPSFHQYATTASSADGEPPSSLFLQVYLRWDSFRLVWCSAGMFIREPGAATVPSHFLKSTSSEDWIRSQRAKTHHWLIT